MKKQDSSEKTWDLIAEKWNEYRDSPSPTVINFLKDKEGKILDLGCGSGRNFVKSKNFQFYGVDFSKQMIKYAEKKKIAKKLKQSPAEKIPYPDDFFDSAISVALLHCIKTKTARQRTIKEMHRVLKPGSQALISVWSKNSPRLKNREKECFIPWTIQTRKDGKIKQKRYTYIYDKEELENEVKKAGFKILKSWEERNINIIAEKIPNPAS